MQELPRTLKLATVWMVLGTAVFVGVQYVQRERSQAAFSVEGDRIEIRRSADGHYHWRGTIQGEPVEFLLDTGATSSAMSATLAQQLRLPTLGQVRSQTAAGSVVADVVRADVRLDGGVAIDRLPLVALPGLGERPLLGMDVLGRLDWRQRDGVLVIERRGDRRPS